MPLVGVGGVCPECHRPPGTLPSHPGLHHACLTKQLPSTHTCQSLRPHSLPECPVQTPKTFRAALKPPHLKSSVGEGLSPPEARLLRCSITQAAAHSRRREVRALEVMRECSGIRQW